MCLAIPSKIVHIDENGLATVDVNGVCRKTSLQLIEDPQVGDFVIVHAGFAIHKMDEALALETLTVLRESLLIAR